MYAIVECMGFQYRVAPDEVVQIPHTELEPGATLVFDRVLLVGDGQSIQIGTPLLANARVEAKVVRHGRSRKIVVGKFKKRKDYRRRKGHRQDFTEIQIQQIQL